MKANFKKNLTSLDQFGQVEKKSMYLAYIPFWTWQVHIQHIPIHFQFGYNDVSGLGLWEVYELGLKVDKKQNVNEINHSKFKTNSLKIVLKSKYLSLTFLVVVIIRILIRIISPILNLFEKKNINFYQICILLIFMVHIP